MFKVRRIPHEPRIELAPLIDVMLFLLTFFIYSVMVMERVDLIPMSLRTYQSGTAAKPVPAATISVDLDGSLYLDRVAVALDELVPKLEEARANAPDLVVYLALADGDSPVDRSTILLDIWDRLQPSKFNVNIVGRQQRGPATRELETPEPTAPATGPTVPTIPTAAPSTAGPASAPSSGPSSTPSSAPSPSPSNPPVGGG
ncbi:MAG: ExbD/TolR family protein [bacterium]